MGMIEKYPDKPWDWVGGISQNDNLTMEMIEKYPDKPWNWDCISRNMFKADKVNFDARVAYQAFVQANIFEELVKVYMHPKRIEMLLELGYDIEELDDIM
jgi:hypothetical protein